LAIVSAVVNNLKVSPTKMYAEAHARRCVSIKRLPVDKFFVSLQF